MTSYASFSRWNVFEERILPGLGRILAMARARTLVTAESRENCPGGILPCERTLHDAISGANVVSMFISGCRLWLQWVSSLLLSIVLWHRRSSRDCNPSGVRLLRLSRFRTDGYEETLSTTKRRSARSR
jgi:hypothetical protein